MMRGKPAVLAVVFDFDETLVSDSTSKLLQAHGVDPTAFWTEHVRRRLEQGFAPDPRLPRVDPRVRRCRPATERPPLQRNPGHPSAASGSGAILATSTTPDEQEER